MTHRNVAYMRGGMSLYPFRSAVSSWVANTGMVPNYRGTVSPPENHMLFCNFMGPGTQIDKRIARGDKGTTASDEAAKTHDIAYRDLSKDIREGKANPIEVARRVRRADNKLISDIAKGRETDKSLLNAVHSIAGTSGMNIKKIAENVGVLSPGAFVGKGSKATKVDPAHRLRKIATRLSHSKKHVARLHGGQDVHPLPMDEEALRAYLMSLPTPVLNKIESLQSSGGLLPALKNALKKLEKNT